MHLFVVAFVVAGKACGCSLMLVRTGLVYRSGLIQLASNRMSNLALSLIKSPVDNHFASGRKMVHGRTLEESF